jgi:hypothetical protein
MSIGRMVFIVLGFSLVGAVLGSTIGVLMGLYIPGFYYGAFPATQEPVHVGLGFGFSQGMTMGFILGCVVLIVRAVLTQKQRP